MTNSPSESSLSWLWKIFSGARKEKTNTITIPKFTDHPQDEVNLATALQYGTATGLPQLQKFINNFVEKVYQPGYADWTTLVQTGNTDGSVSLSRLPAVSMLRIRCPGGPGL